MKYQGTFKNCPLYANLSLSGELDDTLGSRLQLEEWVGILLGCSVNKCLTVDSHGDFAERIGIVDFEWSSYLVGARQRRPNGDSVAPSKEVG